MLGSPNDRKFLEGMPRVIKPGAPIPDASLPKLLKPVRYFAGRSVLMGIVDAASSSGSFVVIFVATDDDAVEELVLVDKLLANPVSGRSDKRYLRPSCVFFLSELIVSCVMMRCRISLRILRFRSISFCISCRNSAENTGPFQSDQK